MNFKKYCLSITLLLSVLPLLAQNKLQVSERDISGVVFREAVDNETVVEVKSNVALEFESTMDKAVNVYKSYEESGFFFYELLFPTDKKYKGRKLKIKSYDFDTYTQPLELQAKVPVGLLVIDPNSDVGVGCYFEHLNKGNKFFANTQYADAKTEYYLALECADVPEDNDLSKKIEDAGAALDSKKNADKDYNAGFYIEAKREYEKLYGLNPNDDYPAKRIAACDIWIPNLPRTFRVKVTGENGQPVSDVSFSVDEYKVDKKGNLVLDKNKKPQKKKGFVQVTATYYDGVYSVTAKNVNKTLALRKYIDNEKEYYDEVQIPMGTDIMEVKLIKIKMTSLGKTKAWTDAIKAVGEGLGQYNKK
jgi:tetratricopeptide (TPR) repeat protein